MPDDETNDKNNPTPENKKPDSEFLKGLKQSQEDFEELFDEELEEVIDEQDIRHEESLKENMLDSLYNLTTNNENTGIDIKTVHITKANETQFNEAIEDLVDKFLDNTLDFLVVNDNEDIEVTTNKIKSLLPVVIEQTQKEQGNISQQFIDKFQQVAESYLSSSDNPKTRSFRQKYAEKLEKHKEVEETPEIENSKTTMEQVFGKLMSALSVLNPMNLVNKIFSSKVEENQEVNINSSTDKKIINDRKIQQITGEQNITVSKDKAIKNMVRKQMNLRKFLPRESNTSRPIPMSPKKIQENQQNKENTRQ